MGEWGKSPMISSVTTLGGFVIFPLFIFSIPHKNVTKLVLEEQGRIHVTC